MIRLDADISELQHLLTNVEHMHGEVERPARLLLSIGDEVADQTRFRIREEKRDPQGKAWKPWSDSYAATRKPHHSLLIDTRAMLGNIKQRPEGADTVRVWADTEYSGAVNRVRQFVGVSDDNARSLESLLVAFVSRALGGA